MSLEAISNVISKVAPILGNVLIGNTGGAVMELITSVFGGDPKNPEDVINRIKQDPEYAVKLAKIQADNIVRLQELEIERLAIQNDGLCAQFEDVQDARKYGGRDETQRQLAIGFTVGFFLYLISLYWFPQFKNEMIIGGLIAIEGQIINFYYGGMFRMPNTLKKEKE